MSSNTSYTFDDNGNTLGKVFSGATTQYAWDFENRLSSVVLPGLGGTVGFKYDPFGRRIQKSSASGTTNYLYDGANAIEEINSSVAMLARYTQGMGIDEALAETRSGVNSYYEQDGLRSVTSLSDSAGSLANTYVFDALGNLTSSTGTLGNSFQYTGRDYDSETGLRYYRARYYSANTGRFLNEDPIGFSGGGDFYAYAFNDPMDFSDPSGLCPPDTPKKKRCSIIVGVPVVGDVMSNVQDQVKRIFNSADIDIIFAKDTETVDYYDQNADLRSIHAFGYAGTAPNVIQVDNAQIYAAGRSLNIDPAKIAIAVGIITAHELGHKFLGGGHSDSGVMRNGVDIGTTVFDGIPMGTTLSFTAEQAAAIKKKCMKIRLSRPLKL